MAYFLVFLGAGLGGMARHAINIASTRLVLASGFPYGTLLINILGSFLMGCFIEYAAQRSGINSNLRLFITTGILGGFTTFSAFSLETMLLLAKSQWLPACAYIAASLFLTLGAVFAGFLCIRVLFLHP